jgi:hypothetical protein
MTTITRWIPTWSKPLGAGGFPVVTAAPAYDRHGFPVVQTWEKSVGLPEPVTIDQHVLPAVQTWEIGKN